jgi:hypothetical protein
MDDLGKGVLAIFATLGLTGVPLFILHLIARLFPGKKNHDH